MILQRALFNLLSGFVTQNNSQSSRRCGREIQRL